MKSWAVLCESGNLKQSSNKGETWNITATSESAQFILAWRRWKARRIAKARSSQALAKAQVQSGGAKQGPTWMSREFDRDKRKIITEPKQMNGRRKWGICKKNEGRSLCCDRGTLISFFFKLMPCTLEAWTVIKTSCDRSTVLNMWEDRWKAKSQVSSECRNNTTYKHKQNKHQKEDT